MRPFGVVFLTEGIKALLLCRKILRRNVGFFPEGTMHSFVVTVPLRFTGFYLFGINAQLDSPDRESGQQFQVIRGIIHVQKLSISWKIGAENILSWCDMGRSIIHITSGFITLRT